MGKFMLHLLQRNQLNINFSFPIVGKPRLTWSSVNIG